MKILVACEESATVREAFRKLGHNAWSCDIIPSRVKGNHYQGDVKDILNDEWDMMIAFPPCTHLSVSGARWFKEKQKSGVQQQAIEFFMMLVNAPIKRIAIENPISIMSTHYRKPDQIIQPWQYGHGETKSTCLWLKGLPLLSPTEIVEGREQRVWRLPPSEDRSKLRSKTYQGIANAMAGQWDAS